MGSVGQPSFQSHSSVFRLQTPENDLSAMVGYQIFELFRDQRFHDPIQP